MSFKCFNRFKYVYIRYSLNRSFCSIPFLSFPLSFPFPFPSHSFLFVYFTGTPALTSCNKRKIADAWKSNTAFTATTPYPLDWADDTCPNACVAGNVAFCII